MVDDMCPLLPGVHITWSMVRVPAGQRWPPAAQPEADPADGGRDRRRHGVPGRQEIRAPGPRRPQLYGGHRPHRQDRRWVHKQWS